MMQRRGTTGLRMVPTLSLWLCGLVWLAAVAVAHAAERRYTVKYGDTLSGIARRYALDIEAIKRKNWIDSADKIRQGQVLIIPDVKATEEDPRLDPGFLEQLNQIKVTPRKWKYIVIHHSGIEMGTPTGMDAYHRSNGMTNGLAYHFVIGNGNGMDDGELAIGPRWNKQLDGGHVHSDALNAESIGICLVGNFDQDPPTAKQLAALQALILDLLGRCELSPVAVKTHQQINPIFTRCPGKQFPGKSFLDAVKRSFAKITLLHMAGQSNERNRRSN